MAEKTMQEKMTSAMAEIDSVFELDVYSVEDGRPFRITGFSRSADGKVSVTVVESVPSERGRTIIGRTATYLMEEFLSAFSDNFGTWKLKKISALEAEIERIKKWTPWVK